MKVAIVRYNAGNVQSVTFALQRLGIEPIISDDAEVLMRAERVIFPGVGEASSAMRHLQKNGLDKLIPQLQQPVLGICLGMQLMCRRSEEGNTDGLNIFPVDVVKFTEVEKVPHMGWNTIHDLSNPLFKDISEDSYMYFVHSFYVPDNAYAIAKTTYGMTYASALNHQNFYAAQFHPEKSSHCGEQLLKNFMNL